MEGEFRLDGFKVVFICSGCGRDIPDAYIRDKRSQKRYCSRCSVPELATGNKRENDGDTGNRPSVSVEPRGPLRLAVPSENEYP